MKAMIHQYRVGDRVQVTKDQVLCKAGDTGIVVTSECKGDNRSYFIAADIYNKRYGTTKQWFLICEDDNAVKPV